MSSTARWIWLYVGIPNRQRLGQQSYGSDRWRHVRDHERNYLQDPIKHMSAATELETALSVKHKLKIGVCTILVDTQP